MIIMNTPVVPASMDRPKRVAKQLNEIYRSSPLSRCQAVTARMMFHKDWHALEKAVSTGRVASHAPFDEDLPSELLAERRMRQCDILVAALGDAQAPSTGHFHSVLAAAALAEIQPSAQLAPHQNALPAELPLLSADSVWDGTGTELLPERLAAWCEGISAAHPDAAAVARGFEIGRILRGLKVRPDSAASLLRFGVIWAGLCSSYPSEIERHFGAGVAYLLAHRFAAAMLRMDEQQPLRREFSRASAYWRYHRDFNLACGDTAGGRTLSRADMDARALCAMECLAILRLH